MQFWVRDHYRILPTDPRWLELDDEQVEAIYWTHHYAKHGVPNEIVDENFDEKVEQIEELLGSGQAAGGAQDDEFDEVIDDRRN
jgi:hypothetical protein